MKQESRIQFDLFLIVFWVDCGPNSPCVERGSKQGSVPPLAVSFPCIGLAAAVCSDDIGGSRQLSGVSSRRCGWCSRTPTLPKAPPSGNCTYDALSPRSVLHVVPRQGRARRLLTLQSIKRHALNASHHSPPVRMRVPSVMNEQQQSTAGRAWETAACVTPQTA